jgi:hypothetical protein
MPKALRAILALSPSQAAGIRFIPALPAGNAALIEAKRAGGGGGVSGRPGGGDGGPVRCGDGAPRGGAGGGRGRRH